MGDACSEMAVFRGALQFVLVGAVRAFEFERERGRVCR